MIRMPRLLDDKLYEVDSLTPTSLSLEMQLDNTYRASMTLADDYPIHLHDWVRVYTENEDAGIYRVTGISHEYGKQKAVTLMHGFDILADQIYPAEVEFSGTVGSFFTDVLGRQTSLIGGTYGWQLGTCDIVSSTAYNVSIRYDTLADLIRNFMDHFPEFYMSFDQSSLPWTFNILSRPASLVDASNPGMPETEFRLARNVLSCAVTQDDSDLCTRVYLTVNGSQVWNYNDADAQQLYGIIAKHFDITTADYPSPQAYARWYLREHNKPHGQITLDVRDIHGSTGEDLDKISISKLGRLARLALPDYGETYEETLLSIKYPDLLNEPDRSTVELAHQMTIFTQYAKRNGYVYYNA